MVIGVILVFIKSWLCMGYLKVLIDDSMGLDTVRSYDMEVVIEDKNQGFYIMDFDIYS